MKGKYILLSCGYIYRCSSKFRRRKKAELGLTKWDEWNMGLERIKLIIHILQQKAILPASKLTNPK